VTATAIRPPGSVRHPPRPTAPPTGQRPAAAPSADRLWIGPTLVAALSVLAGSSALSSTVQGGGWVVPLIEVVGVIWLLGIGSRLLKSPAPVTVLVQFAGLVVALTGLFTTSGWGGFLPNTAVLRESGDLLSGAWQQILVTVPPAPSSVELSFLICLTVGTTTLIVDFLVAEARSPALVALPLLCLYSVPASIATDQLPWLAFVAPAALYAVLLAITGHIGARSRGRTSVGLVGTALIIAAIATLFSVVVGDSVTGIGTQGRLPRTAAGGGSEIGLSPFTSLRGDLQRSDPANLLTVYGLPGPNYLRTTALETWTPTGRVGFSAPSLDDDASANGTLPGVDPGGSDVVSIRIRSQLFSDSFLPIFARTVSVAGLDSEWQFDQQLGTVHREKRLNPRTYTMRAAFPVPNAVDLREDTVSPTEALVATPGVPDEVRRAAEDITSQAATPFDKADALRKYFTDPTNGFVYSLSVPGGTTGNALTDFLANKKGYCEQYATTMAMMLRTIGIPTRVAVGFTQGTKQSDGSSLITTNDAHAWVEVRFDQHGWVQFDPTPLGGGVGNQQGFDEAAPVAPSTTVTAGTSASEDTTTAKNSAQLPDGGAGNRPDDGGTDSAGSASAAQPTGLAIVPAAIWWTLLGLAVLAALLSTPRLVRLLRRRRRLATADAGGAGAASAAWAEVEDLVVDHGIPLRPTESSRAMANRLARTSRLTENARNRLRGLVIAAEQEWYSVDPGQSDTTGKELVAAVSAVSESLNRSSPRSRLDRLVPRSIRPSSRD
jgi:transglutaminase-like putative cysteine protease